MAAAIAAAEPIDVWARQRAKEILERAGGIGPAAIGGACRDWMEIAVAALPPEGPPAR